MIFRITVKIITYVVKLALQKLGVKSNFIVKYLITVHSISNLFNLVIIVVDKYEIESDPKCDP